MTGRRLVLVAAAALGVAVAAGYRRGTRPHAPDCPMCARAAGIP